MRAAKSRLFQSGRCLILFFFLFAFASWCQSYLHGYIASLQLPLIYGGWLYAIVILPLVLAFIAPFLVFRKNICLYLREELRRHGIPVCLPCGYDVTGCRSLICPECGTEFEP